MSSTATGNIRIRAVTTYSDPGTRPQQEDHVLASQDKGIFVVADGFGGPIPGAEASKGACEWVRGFLVKEAGDREATLPFVLRSYFSLAGNVLFNALIHANRKMMAMNQDKGVHEKGGSSVLAAFLDGDLLALANVGGCTAWLFRNGAATELVVPRTYGRLVDPFSESASVPLMALGLAEDMEPEILECKICEGDWLLLQTDGISALARNRIQQLQTIQAPGPDALRPDEIAQQISVIFNEPPAAGPRDNASAVLVVF